MPREDMQGAVLPVPSKNCQHWRHFTSHLGQQEMPKSQKQIDTTFRHRCLHVPYMFFTNNISAFWNPSRFKMCWLDQHLIQSCFLSNILVHVNWKTHGDYGLWLKFGLSITADLSCPPRWGKKQLCLTKAFTFAGKNRWNCTKKDLDILRIKYPYAV